MQLLRVGAVYTDTQTGLTQRLLHALRRNPVLAGAYAAEPDAGGGEVQPCDDDDYTVLGEVADDDEDG